MSHDYQDTLVLGVDGGQTSTKCVLATAAGRVLAEGQGGPLVHLAAEGGRERFVASLGEAIGDAWRRAGRAARPVAAIGLGLTGVEADGPEARVVAELLPRVVEAGRAAIQSDAVGALVGAHAGGAGIIAIAGTGSVVLGQDRRGVRQRAGGWGWLLGDEGSAMAIGRDGLMAALQAIDGVGPPTALRAIFLDHFGVGRPRDVKNVVYAPEFGARGFGQLAALVSRAAADGDAVARAIVARHADLLAQDVLAVARALDLGGDPLRVAPLGGAYEHVVGLRDGFVQALAAGDARLVVRPPLLPPTLGAVLLALEAVGAASSAAREQLGRWATELPT